MITFTSPPAANLIRAALNITDPTTRILITDNTRTVYCDYTGQIANIEVSVYGTDLYENLYVSTEDVTRAIDDLTTDYDVDQIEITVDQAFADQVLHPAAHAA